MKTPDIKEHQAIQLFTKEFGIDKRSRFAKFKEEINELEEAFEYYMNSNEEDKIEALQHILDEFSDVQGTFTHLSSLFGLYQREMLYNCVDKVITRKTNPNYKRFYLSDKLDVVVNYPTKFDEEIMGLKISFIEQEIKREILNNDKSMYLAVRNVPENWNDIKNAYFDFINKKNT